ncbi:hypothetical protein TVAG_268760 [Trichomonas vaginalis G3]|uniref:Uncharacterized protein n=1 Tax=Trichomonas vaginalis (strain ATCC PRA-98 / G3) TaxID=412133 RepID=A2FIW2_TRIV3|nr:SCA1 complex scaffold protein SCAA family [Trichomonas vaginalis G3]EAX95139.1 hypothetical protein TVAG_268760 [Trichomonas vaginalis G3]KAI5515230.1 SCA1 complex scaffold protein SCAA family [Trichomonas vaginalis G3]|eukprot:XP_001308069.1 hypothetical protein [Trichomonas vaginalis G3]
MEEEFPTQLNVPYHYPKPSRQMTNGFSLTSEPAFFDERMYLYDKFYKLIKRISYDANKKGPYSFESYTPNAKYPAFGLLRFPEYNQFDGPVEYHKTITIWKEKVLKFCTGVLLPSPILCKTFIPSRPSILDPSTPYYRKFDPKKYPLQPKNMIFLHEALLSDKPPNYYEVFPQQFPKRDEVVLADHLVNKMQWQSQMVVKEPLTLIYSNFQEYHEAFKNWMNLVTQRFCVQPPIPVRQFKDILKMPKYEPMVSTKFKVDPQKQKDMIKDMPDYSWVSSVKQKGLPRAPHIPKVLKIKYIPIVKTEYENIIVYGVMKETFKQDFIDYGFDTKTKYSEGPVYPFTYLVYHQKDKESIRAGLKKIIKSIQPNDPYSILKFLDYEFNWDVLRLIVSSKIKGTKMLEVILTPPNFDLFKVILLYSQKSIDHSYRCSILLKILIYHSKFTNILPVLFQKENIHYLYQFTRLIMLTCDYNIPLHPVYGDSEIAILIAQAHFASDLIASYIFQIDTQGERDINNICHKITAEIAKYFSIQENKERLFESLRSNEFTEESRCYCTLSIIFSERIIETLFSQDTINIILSILPYKVGKYFIYNCVYANTYKMALLFIRSSLSFNHNNLITVDHNTAYFLGYFIDCLPSFMFSCKGYSPFDHVNRILQTTLNDLNQNLIPFVYSLVKFISNVNSMKLDSINLFQDLIGSAICRIDVQYNMEKNISYKNVLKFLKPISKIKFFPQKFLEAPDLVLAVMDQLESPNMVTMLGSWGIFKAACASQDLMHSILLIGGVDKRLQKLTSSENPYVISEFCIFIKNLGKHDAKLLDLLESLIQPSMGRFACTIKNMDFLFADYAKTKKSINDMLMQVYSVNSKFSTDLTPHLMSLQMDLRRYMRRSTFIFRNSGSN